MKGLGALPTQLDLIQAASELQDPASEPVKSHELALYSQWARLDPRFAEILVQYVGHHWRHIALGLLLTELEKQPWPRAILVILEFAALGAVTRRERVNVRTYIRAIGEAFPELPSPQLFFIPLQGLNRTVAESETLLRTRPYTRAGFIGSQSLLPRARWAPGGTYLETPVRMALLKNLVANQPAITVADYLRTCAQLVSRRQAQRDLTHFPGLRARKFTRARVWEMKV